MEQGHERKALAAVRCRRFVRCSRPHIPGCRTRNSMKEKNSRASQKVVAAPRTRATLSAREPRLSASTQPPTHSRIRSPPRAQADGATGSAIHVPTPDSMNRAGNVASSSKPETTGSTTAAHPLNVGMQRDISPNAADHRPRASQRQYETAASSRGSVHLLCVRLTWA